MPYKDAAFITIARITKINVHIYKHTFIQLLMRIATQLLQSTSGNYFIYAIKGSIKNPPRFQISRK